MMQRGAPTSFPAFSNIIGVSNMYVPFKPDNGQAVRYDQVGIDEGYNNHIYIFFFFGGGGG